MTWRERFNGCSRRDLFRGGGWLAALGLLPGSRAWGVRVVAVPPLTIGREIYQSIGVRPLINCTGAYTIVSGSQTLPEVKKAMDEASRHYVHMDELMDGVGKRLAEITGAEWGIVTAGCAAALTHATSASIAGADPEKMQRLPNLTGLKNEVIMPRSSRNVYDHAIRLLGVKIVEVDNREQFANKERFPEADQVYAEEYEDLFPKLTIHSSSYIVIVTRGHRQDAAALRACIHKDAAYIGMIGSRRKIALMRRDFGEQGWRRRRSSTGRTRRSGWTSGRRRCRRSPRPSPRSSSPCGARAARSA